MNRTDAITWVLTVCASLRLSQAKTLGDLVAATLGVGRVSLAEIGRRLAGPVAAKHRIKCVWCFTSNQRVEISDAMKGVVVRRPKQPSNSCRKVVNAGLISKIVAASMPRSSCVLAQPTGILARTTAFVEPS